MGSAFPKASFLLFVYNQEAFVGAAVEAALAQDYPNLEILISDDCSPDGSGAVIWEAVRAYTGPHDVRVFRNAENLGIAKHVQRLTATATGELLIMAAGDDISHPARTRTLVDVWQQAGGTPAMLYSDYRALALDGTILAERSPVISSTPPNLMDACRGILDVHGGSSAITQSLVTEFSPIASDVVYEDRVFPFRALLLDGKILYIDEPLVDYRVHGGISRKPLDPSAFKAFRATNEQRKLADARQRLRDLEERRGWDAEAHRLCTTEVQEQECRSAFASSKAFAYEGLLLRFLGSGARISLVLKIYLRYRLEALGLRPPS